MTKNLTVGPPGPLIVGFAIPLIVGNLFQQFYNMADTFIVGRTIGMHALAAIGCTGPIAFLLIGFVMGVTAGAAIITSQRFGAQNEDGVRISFASSVIISIAITFVLMVIGISTLMPFLRLLNTPSDIIDDAYKYFVVILIGLPALTLFNVLSNMMRSVGDSRTPLIFLAVACVINVVLDYTFILVFHSGVIGAGIATVIAQLVSGIACFFVIKKHLPILCPTKKDWQVSMKELIEHLKIALPVGFQWSIIAIGTIAVQYALNDLGTTAVAAFTTAEKIDQFAVMPLSSFGQAMITFSAQNFGAKKYARIREGLLQASIMVCAFSIVMFFLFLFFGSFFAGIFLNTEMEAIELSHEYLIVSGASFTLLALLFILRETIQGLGDSITATVSGILELVMRTFAAIILTDKFGFIGLCFASPLAFVGALIALTISWRFKVKMLNRLQMREAKIQKI
ncbi:MAG: MATE family efflux transporter [Termitinemataceae bacterium]|nr:MAG: MATE family efflux transporter [Termitinemataceae bacterium]